MDDNKEGKVKTKRIVLIVLIEGHNVLEIYLI